MQNKQFRFGPIALTNTYTTNLLNPPTASGGTNGGSSAQYILLRHVRVVNKDSSARTFRLYLGATGANAAGTEIAYDVSVAVGSYQDLYWANGLRLDSADFLVGGASAATALTIEGEGEVGVSG